MFGPAPVGYADRGERSDIIRYGSPIVIGVLALVGLFTPPSSFARNFDCPQRLGNVRIDGDLDIAMPCELIGTRVSGDVRIFAGGSLLADRASIGGNLRARRADYVVLIETTVDGNVDFDELVGDRSAIDLSEIDGNLRLRRNRSHVELLDNMVDGSVRVERNTGGVLILRNVIDGDLTCRRNRPPPVGSDNRLSGQASGQCARLSLNGAASATDEPENPEAGTEPEAPGQDDTAPDSGVPPDESVDGEPESAGPDGGAGPGELVLDPQPSGGGAALGPVEVLVLLLTFSAWLRRRRPSSKFGSHAPAERRWIDG